MSLKNFHIVFISVCVLFCLGFGIWCLQSPIAQREGAATLLGVTSFAFAAALVVYELLFLRKLKHTGVTP